MTASSGDVSTNSTDIDWPKLFRDEPLGSTMVQGMSSSEFPNAYDPVQTYAYNLYDRPPRRREIRFDQPYRGSNDYPDDLNYDDLYVRPCMPGIPVPHRKQRIQEKSALEIMRENNDREQTQKIQSLSKKLDKWEREDQEREKKLQEEATRKLLSTENNQNPEIHRNNQVPTCQNIGNRIVPKPAVTEATGKASIEIKDKEPESKERDVLPWIGTCLEIAVDSGAFDYIGRKTGEWIFKPNKPTKGTLREIKKSR